MQPAEAVANPYRPQLLRIDGCFEETPDVRTLRLQFVDPGEARSFTGWKAGQFAEFTVFGAGECVFTLANAPWRLDGSPESVLGTAGVQLRPAAARCLDCHSDAHRGQLSGRPDGGDCASCHRVEGFAPSGFTVADHAATSFPLLGSHEKVACAARPRLAEARAAFMS